MAASEKEIRISLKMLADVKDAKKLADYIHTLGSELKKAGGDGADSLRKKLLDIKKSLYSGDRSSASVKGLAGQVSALMPDITKTKALGSLGAIEKKLASFGTAQAKAIIGTVGKIRAAFQSGDLSEGTVDLLSASFEKLVEQAKKLPPPQMAKLGKDMRGLIENTQELKDAVEAVNGVNFKIDLSGKGSTGELFQKINIAETAQELNKSLDAMSDHMVDFGEAGQEAASEIYNKFKKLLDGPLGKDTIKSLKEVEAQAVKMAASLSEKDLLKAGPIFEDIIRKSQSLQSELGKTGNKIADEFDLASSLTNAFDLRLNAVTEAVVGLAAKIPAVGKAMLALPMGAILAGIAAIYKLIGDCLERAKEIRQIDREIRFKTLESTLNNITREFDAQNHLLDLQYSKEERMISLARERRDAEREVEKQILETQKALELSKALTDDQREQIEMRYQQKFDALESRNERRVTADTKEDLELKIARLKDEIKIAKDQKDAYNAAKSAAEEDRAKAKKEQKGKNAWGLIGTIGTEAAAGAGVGLVAGSVIPGIGNAAGAAVGAVGGAVSGVWDAWKASEIRDEAAEEAEELGKKIQDIQSNLADTTKDIQKKEEELKKLEGQLKIKSEVGASGKTRDATLNDEREKARKAEQERKEIERKRKLAREQHARDREVELFEYDQDLAERQYQRGKRQPWQNTNQQIEEAEKEELRYREEEAEALKSRNRLLKKIAADVAAGRGVMEEDERDLQEATQDLTRARSSRIQEQTTIDSLRKELHDRQFQEAENQHSIEREDADWRRSGRYERGNWASKLRMDEERYLEARKQYEEADAKIKADNNGTSTLSPEQRQIVERQRNEARQYLTSSRDAMRSSLMSGDEQRANFATSLMSHRNRLTAMGLGGDVADWDKQTARNTQKLVEQNKELLKSMQQKYGDGFGWSL